MTMGEENQINFYTTKLYFSSQCHIIEIQILSKLKHENHKTKDQYIWEYSGNQMYAQEYLENQMKVCGAALTITNRTAPFLSPRTRYSKI